MLNKINLDTFAGLIKESAAELSASGNYTDEFKGRAQRLIDFVRAMDKKGVALWDGETAKCWCGAVLRSAEEARNHGLEAWKDPWISETLEPSSTLRPLHLGEPVTAKYVNLLVAYVNHIAQLSTNHANKEMR